MMFAASDLSRDAIVIGGDWSVPHGAGRHRVISPSDEEHVGELPVSDAHDIDAAVRSARDAFEHGPWRRSTLEDRLKALRRVRQVLEDSVERLTALSAAELGTPISQSRGRHLGALALFDETLDVASNSLRDGVRPDHIVGRTAIVRPEPVGVVAAITPFNGPFSMSISKCVRALAAGCSVVLKPSLEGALHTYILAEAIREADLPDGVFSLVPGDRAAGEALVSHSDIDMVTLTGSTGAGRAIGAICGRDIRRANLELGGKSAAIVCDDVDIGTVVPWLSVGAFGNAGQVCVALSRVLAPRRLYADVVAALVAASEDLVAGDPTDPATTLGPLVTSAHRDHVAAMVDEAVVSGATVAAGGQHHPARSKGWFYAPTVLSDVSNDMAIAQEEVFGPVVVVIPYDDDDEAVRLANASQFGLHGAVFSSDLDRAFGIADRVRSGTLAVNGYGISLCAPFGGMKSSGLGREGGPEGFADFIEYKTVIADADSAAWWERHRSNGHPLATQK